MRQPQNMNLVKMTVNGKVLVQEKSTPRSRTQVNNLGGIEIVAGGPVSALMYSPPEGAFNH